MDARREFMFLRGAKEYPGKLLVIGKAIDETKFSDLVYQSYSSWNFFCCLRFIPHNYSPSNFISDKVALSINDKLTLHLSNSHCAVETESVTAVWTVCQPSSTRGVPPEYCSSAVTARFPVFEFPALLSGLSGVQGIQNSSRGSCSLTVCSGIRFWLGHARFGTKLELWKWMYTSDIGGRDLSLVKW